MYPKDAPLTAEQEAYIHNLYYKRKMYFGMMILYDYIFNNRPSNIPHIYRKKVDVFLKSQKIHQFYEQGPKQKVTRQIYSSKKGKLL